MQNVEDVDYDDLRPSFDQVHYESILQRVESGSQCLFEFTKIINYKLEFEERNIAFLSHIAKTQIYHHEVTSSSSEKALGFLKNYHLYLSKEHVALYKELAESVHQSLEDIKTSRATVANKHKLALVNSAKEVTLAMDALDKAKKNHQKASVDLQTAKTKLAALEVAVVEANKALEEKKQSKDKEKYSMGRSMMSAFETAFESTPEHDRQRQSRRVARRYNELITCGLDIAGRKKILIDKLELRDESIAKATSAFQALEDFRLLNLKSAIKQLCQLERHALETRSKLLTDLEGVCDSQMPEQDISLFIAQKKKPEWTHKYSKAVRLLDQDYVRRHSVPVERPPVTVAGVSVPGPEDEGGSSGWGEREAMSSTGSNRRGSAGSVSAEAAVATTVQQSSDTAAVLADESSVSDGVDPADASTSCKGLDTVDLSEGNVAAVAADSSNQSGGAAPDDELLNDSDNNQVDVVVQGAVIQASEVDELAVARVAEALAVMFARGKNTVNSPVDNQPVIVSDAQWREVLTTRETTDFFLRELDEKRGRHAGLAPAAYASMKFGMKVVLDFCQQQEDVKSALRIANMANTFHVWDAMEVLEDVIYDSEEAAAGAEDPTVKSRASSISVRYSEYDLEAAAAREKRLAARVYVQSEPEIREHEIWRGKGFWAAALNDCIECQMSLNAPVLWDELSLESLREHVIVVHNIVFGQLGTIAFTMHELGLSHKMVEAAVLEMSHAYQLSQDQEHELLKSIRRAFGVQCVVVPVPKGASAADSLTSTRLSSEMSSYDTNNNNEQEEEEEEEKKDYDASETL